MFNWSLPHCVRCGHDVDDHHAPDDRCPNCGLSDPANPESAAFQEFGGAKGWVNSYGGNFRNVQG